MKRLAWLLLLPAAAVAVWLAIPAAAQPAAGAGGGMTRGMAQGMGMAMGMGPMMSQEMREMAELRHELVVIDTINHLNLSKDQMRQIVNLGAQAESLRQQDEAALKPHLEKVRALLLEVRAALIAGQKPGPELLDQLRKQQAEGQQTRTQDTGQMKEIAKRLNEILTPKQRNILLTYQSPLAGPMMMGAGPGRGGMARQGQQPMPSLGKEIQRLRAVPEAGYPGARAAFLERVSQICEQRTGQPLPPESLQKLGQLLDKARAMSDEEFAQNKGQLVKGLRAALPPMGPGPMAGPMPGPMRGPMAGGPPMPGPMRGPMAGPMPGGRAGRMRGMQPMMGMTRATRSVGMLLSPTAIKVLNEMLARPA